HRHPGMPTVAVPVGIVGPLERAVIMNGCEWFGVGERIANVAWGRAAGAVVAALLDPLLEGRDVRTRWVILDGCRLRDRVRIDREDAGLRAELPLPDGLLGGVLEPAGVQDGRLAFRRRGHLSASA